MPAGYGPEWTLVPRMEDILWLDLSGVSAALDRLCAEREVHRRAGTLIHAGDLQSHVDKLTARRKQLVSRLLDRLSGEVAELPSRGLVRMPPGN
jgi:hypothetical protein